MTNQKTKQDVALFSGLSKAIGSAKNLAEFGTGVAGVAEGIEAQKDKFRAEDLELNKARVANEMAISELSKANREERAKLEGTLTSVMQADSVANINNQIELLKQNVDMDKAYISAAIEVIKNQSYERYIDTLDADKLNGEERLIRDTLNQLNDALSEAFGDPETSEALRGMIRDNQNLLDKITLRRQGGAGRGNQIITDLADM